MALHAQAEALLAELAADGLLLDDGMSVAEIRAVVAAKPLAAGDDVDEVADLEVEAAAGTLTVRRYRPLGAEAVTPLVLYFHGGGWVTGNLETHDARCRALASLSGCSFLAVDYRLAPEHPFPAAYDDAVTALRWAVEHAGALGCDAGRLAVAGDSSGGNLAAAVAIAARDEGIVLRHQSLVYPVVDAFPERHASFAEFAAGPLLTTGLMRRYLDAYAGRADRTDWRLAPLCRDDLSGVAPALILTAELDPLRDEAEEYGLRLAEAGVAVDMTRYSGMFHGFLAFPDRLDAARGALGRVATALRRATSR